MPTLTIKMNSKVVGPHKAYVKPTFNKKTILVDSHFSFIEMWLQRQPNSREAKIYWEQAKNFYNASRVTEVTSKPLVSYYCMLNAAKSLLALNNIEVSPFHGIAGEPSGNKAMLTNESIHTKTSGVFIGLSQYFGASLENKEVSLKDVLYNLPFIHRAFTTTHPSMKELFIPIYNPHFVRKAKSEESWFCASVKDSQYAKKSIFEKQRGWEVDESSDDFLIRRKRRFKWSTKAESKSQREANLLGYHAKIRRDIKYIHSKQRLWYYKRNDRSDRSVLTWPTPSLTYLAMHRLSEICRYEPERLERHFNTQHNWLLNEFINHSLPNFIDQIACEISGLDLMSPKIR